MSDMSTDLTALSRTISHALRHRPGQYGLTLDPDGWVELEDLLAALRARGRQWADVDRGTLEEMMRDASKQRFEIAGTRIRARYGHSTGGQIVGELEEPPQILYHGTPPEAAVKIRVEGLRPMRRQSVHLSADIETAQIVGGRRSDHPVILKVAARDAWKDGARFWRGNDTTWLSDAIPAEYLTED
jgi:putative RNA 2'-phosphotransferase